MRAARFRSFSPYLLWILALVFQNAAWGQDAVMRYTARAGDSFYRISKTFLKEEHTWQDLASINRSSNVHLIPLGTQIDIPVAWLAARPASATLVSYFGKVEIRSAKTGWQQAVKDARIHVGEAVRLGANSSGRLVLADQSTVMLQPNTTVELDTISLYAGGYMSDTKLRLQSGRIEVEANPRKRPFQGFQVITPSAVTAVRGTKFTVEAQATRTLMQTTEGQVEISNERGTALVSAGFGSIALAGQQPLAPAKLSDPPQVRVPGSPFRQLPVGFSIEAFAADKVYIAQVERLGTFAHLVQEKTVDQDQFSVELFKNGQYQLKLWSVDPSGMPSKSAVFPFEVALPLHLLGKPVKLSKNDFGNGSIELNLPATPGAGQFILELTTDPEGLQAVWNATQATGAVRIPSPEIDARNYYLWMWRY